MADTAAADARAAVAFLRTGNNPALRRFADGLDAFLAAGGEITLNTALGFAPARGHEHWTATDARARRDDALRELAEHLAPGERKLLPVALRVIRSIKRYGAAGWSTDRPRGYPPDNSDTERRLQFDIYSLSKGHPPLSPSRVREIISNGRDRRSKLPTAAAFDKQKIPV